MLDEKFKARMKSILGDEYEEFIDYGDCNESYS